jgi:2-oxoglutarate dehydrogenase E1 component
MCSGQVYYDLLAAREERKIEHVAIARLEQMYPFPTSGVQVILARYPALAEVVWVQEEPRNMGAWRFVQEQMQSILEPSRRVLRYIGRPESASTSSGSLKRHQEEQAEIVESAFAAEIQSPVRKRRTARRKR